MKPMALPLTPHPKHLYIPLDGLTVKEPVFSLWNGHSPIKFAPRLRSVTYVMVNEINEFVDSLEETVEEE